MDHVWNIMLRILAYFHRNVSSISSSCGEGGLQICGVNFLNEQLCKFVLAVVVASREISMNPQLSRRGPLKSKNEPVLAFVYLNINLNLQ